MIDNSLNDKDYTFDMFCELLIKDQLKFHDEGKLGGNYQAHLLKGKVKHNDKERG